MANRTISTQSLTPGELFCVRGKLTYGRLAKQVDGEELEKDKQRRAARGMRPIERPYTSATITDAYVPLKDENNPTIEERYAQESLYISHANDSHGFNFFAANRGNRLPWIGVRDPQDPFKVEQIVLPNELASGLDVTLVMRVFQTRASLLMASSSTSHLDTLHRQTQPQVSVPLASLLFLLLLRHQLLRLHQWRMRNSQISSTQLQALSLYSQSQLQHRLRQSHRLTLGRMLKSQRTYLTSHSAPTAVALPITHRVTVTLHSNLT